MASEQKRLFLALSLSALVLFTWQAYFAPKPEFDASLAKEKKENTTNEVTGNTSVPENPDAEKKVDSSPEGSNAPLAAGFSRRTVLIENTDANLSISSDMTLLDAKGPQASDAFTSVVGSKKALKFYVLKEGSLTAINMDEFVATGDTVRGKDSKKGISFVGSIEADGTFKWSFVSTTPYQYYLSSVSEKKEGEGRQIRQFLTHLKDVERNNIDDEEEMDGTLNWFGIDFHYHLFATVFDKKQVSAIRIKNESLGIKIVEPTTRFEGSTFFVQKSYNKLKDLKNNLHLAVDFGVFGIIAVPILKGLQFIYKYIPNYGLAIILITLFIRTLLFPLQFKSFKSMKKMQKLQPELAKVKEKYGDDPQRMQKETMELFKKNGANPMGGCLPLLLQMPVFFAFYQVLFNSVELLNAPFILWIHDLSAKDPYYVLPVLMGIAMFGQTKLNPSTTADPTQQKMMMFMPLIFTFFMKDLPAGLNLYIFVSTLFGIIQQLFVYKTVD